MKRIITILAAAMALTGAVAQVAVSPSAQDRGTAQVLVEPTEINFTCLVGETVTDTITVTNIGTVAFTPLSSFSSDHGYIWVEPINSTIPPAPGDNVRKTVVTYSPEEAGTHQAHLSMYIDGEFYDVDMTGVATMPTEQTDWVYYNGTPLEGGRYLVEISCGEVGDVFIYYRIMKRILINGDIDWETGEWMDYVEPLEFDPPGYYRIESYAVAPGKLPSVTIAYEISLTEPVPNYDFVENGIYYKITDDDKVTVTYEDESYGSYSGVVSIPNLVTHDGVTYMVTAIGDNAFSDCFNLTNVNIGSYVTSIGNNAFSNCILLTEVNIGDYVISIGDQAFIGCQALKRVTLGSGLNHIGTDAFAYCYDIEDIICKAATPPVIDDYYSFMCYQTATLHVYPPVQDSYSQAWYWDEFSTIIGEDAVDPAPSDVNGDGVVSIKDVTELIDQLLNGI
ncbi:MAG: leucine-rich repeat protein [Muribaculaceae bacterium]|nr:leucine-rich repeat protein [Muribaculaceae bacterium]